MSQPFKFKYQNEIVGLFVLAAMGVLMAGIVLLGRTEEWFQATWPAYVEFDDRTLGFIRPGTPVRLRSREVGRVNASQIDEDGKLVVTLEMSGQIRDAIRTDTEAVLVEPMAGLPGESFLDIRGGSKGDPVGSESRIKGRVADDVLRLAVDVLTDLREVMKPTFVEVHKLTARANMVLDRVEELDEDPVQALLVRGDALLVRIDGLLARTDATLGTAQKLLDGIERGEGLIGQAMADPTLYAKAVALVAQLARAMTRVERMLVEADRMGKAVPGMVDTGRKALEDVARITRVLAELSPRLPGLVGEVDTLLFESRGVLQAAERHWLIGGALAPEGRYPIVAPTGLRDTTADEPLEGAATAPAGGSPRP